MHGWGLWCGAGPVHGTLRGRRACSAVFDGPDEAAGYPYCFPSNMLGWGLGQGPPGGLGGAAKHESGAPRSVTLHQNSAPAQVPPGGGRFGFVAACGNWRLVWCGVRTVAIQWFGLWRARARGCDIPAILILKWLCGAARRGHPSLAWLRVTLGREERGGVAQ